MKPNHDFSSQVSRARLANKLRWIVFAILLGDIAWFWLSAMVLEMLGKPESAAWVGLYLIPTLVACIVIGAVGILVPSRTALIALVVVTAIHAAVGFGWILE